MSVPDVWTRDGTESDSEDGSDGNGTGGGGGGGGRGAAPRTASANEVEVNRMVDFRVSKGLGTRTTLKGPHLCGACGMECSTFAS